MQRPDAGEVVDLVTARRAGGDEDAFGSELAGGRQEAPFADLPGNVEMLARVAERARHAAAAGVEVGDPRPGDAVEERLRGRHQAEGLLVAVAVEEDLVGAGAERE